MPAPPFYRQQLARDLDHWIDSGLVPETSRESILDSAGQGGAGVSISSILYILGAVLIGAAAIAFVAANWDAIPRATKLFTLILALWTAYGLAIWTRARAAHALSGALVLIGIAIYGASISLIGQIYHLSGDAADAMLLWGIGAMLAAILVPSRAALAAAAVIGVLWTWYVAKDGGSLFGGSAESIHWAYLAYWLVGLFAAFRFGWRPGVHLHLIGLVIWLALYTADLAGALGWEGDALLLVFPTYTMFWLALWALARSIGDLFTTFRTTSHYALLLGFAAGLFLLYPDAWAEADVTMPQSGLVIPALLGLGGIAAAAFGLVRGRLKRLDVGFIVGATATVLMFTMIAPSMSPGPFSWIATALYIGGAVWLVAHGSTNNDRFALNLGFVSFAVAVMAIYFRAFGGLMGNALFFLILGVVLLGGGALLNKVRRRMIARDAEGTP